MPRIQFTNFSINYFFSKCDQIRRFLRIWSYLLKKALMEKFISCAVKFKLLLDEILIKWISVILSVSIHSGKLFYNKQKHSPVVFCKKGVFRDFAKFTGKHLCQSVFFNKVGLRPATLLKKRLWHRCFPVNFEKFLRTPFLTEHLWWLLLNKPLKMISPF